MGCPTALQAALKAERFNCFSVVGLQFRHGVPGAAEKGAAIQFALFVQRNHHSMNMWRAFVQVKNRFNDTVAIFFLHPFFRSFFPCPELFRVIVPGLSGVVWPEIFWAGAHEYFHGKHGVLSDFWVADGFFNRFTGIFFRSAHQTNIVLQALGIGIWGFALPEIVRVTPGNVAPGLEFLNPHNSIGHDAYP